MFQDESVKTILTRSHKAPQAARHPAKLFTPESANNPLLASNDSILPSSSPQPTRTQASPRTTFSFFSTASASTISSLLTFFPKCFSSFLHSTCSLSVSYIYLALEEVYLPLCALVSKYTTLEQPARLDTTPQTGLSPSLAVRSRTLLRRF